MDYKNIITMSYLSTFPYFESLSTLKKTLTPYKRSKNEVTLLHNINRILKKTNHVCLQVSALGHCFSDLHNVDCLFL